MAEETASNPEPDYLIFQFRFRFDPGSLSRDSAGRFEANLRAWFIARKYDYGFGALGGSAIVYGDVGRHGADATPQDRESLIEWVRQQRIRCNVALGDLEPQSTANITRELTEVVFDLDQLSEDDRH